MKQHFIGVLPAGGNGSRLAPFRYPKELLPVVYDGFPDEINCYRPKVVAEYALEAFLNAGVSRCLVITAPWKQDLIRYFGSGSEFGLNIAYVYQEEANGLSQAVDLAYPWIAEHHVVFAMPDTLFHPRDSLLLLRTLYVESRSDLSLCVFPTSEAERLGPVLLQGEKVLAVYDKCQPPPALNTWGAAIWGPRFSELLHHELSNPTPLSHRDTSLGRYFELAIKRNLTVTGFFFGDGTYLDVGTPGGIRCWFEMIARTKAVV